MIKRLVVGVFVSGLTMLTVAPAATAATSSDAVVVKAAKPTPGDGGATTQRIDWD